MTAQPCSLVCHDQFLTAHPSTTRAPPRCELYLCAEGGESGKKGERDVHAALVTEASCNRREERAWCTYATVFRSSIGTKYTW